MKKMANINEILELLFKRVPVESVIAGRISCMNFTEEEFCRLSFPYQKKMSEIELSNIWRYYKNIFERERRMEMADTGSREPGLKPFDAIFYYVDKILIVQNNEVLCQYEKLLKWRMATFALSEDLLVSAYWARKKDMSEMSLIGFEWPTVICHNNYQLNRIMQRGISENHFHLYGSAPIFHISWVSLMNHVLNSRAAVNLKKYDLQRRNSNIRYNANYREHSLLHQYYQAALIRVFLFSVLTNAKMRIGNYNVLFRDYISMTDLRGLLQSYRIDADREIEVKDLKDEVDRGCTAVQLLDFVWGKCGIQDLSLQNRFEKLLEGIKCPSGMFERVAKKSLTLHGILHMLLALVTDADLEHMSFLMPSDVYSEIWNHITFCNINEILRDRYLLEGNLGEIQGIIEGFRNKNADGSIEADAAEDYTMIGVQKLKCHVNEQNSLFAGERWFLYACLQKLWRKKEMWKYADLFYSYVLIRETLRSELIQTNDNVGFENFHNYERRKMGLIGSSIFQDKMVQKAVGGSLLSKNIQSLEIRISPLNTGEENYYYIKKLDEIIGKSTDVYFYTMHFLKSKDKAIRSELVHCRHYHKRREARRKANALLELRERYPETAKRILGIDGASTEIGCRPEVFASVFRQLKDHRGIIDRGVERDELPQLRATFHVGEDFLDVVDGLRAIDEAVNFLNLECGDRLGHAIALGIDVAEWYQSKGNKVYLSKQDYLDNLVWMYHYLIQFRNADMDILRNDIEKEFSRYFREIYLNNMNAAEQTRILEEYRQYMLEKHGRNVYVNERVEFDIFYYYKAWKLRGDDPELYKQGYFKYDEDEFASDYYYVNRKFPKEYDSRRMPEVALLYYYYHFNNGVRQEGESRIEVKIKPVYVEGVAAIQKALQKRIAERGIGIETNPSSNYLIGTFKKYESHPIFQLYNRGLVDDEEQLKECPQMFVSVNTDDMGVFSTSLENEYGLLARALEGVTDKNGAPCYKKANIYEWIDAVRQMGNDQSFRWQKNNFRPPGNKA